MKTQVLGCAFGCAAVGLITGAASGAIVLGAAEPFAVLGASTVTNTGLSVLTGDVGVSPGTAITGFGPGIVIGTVHSNDAVAMQAQIDVSSAYNVLAGMAMTQDLSGMDLGGMTLAPGVYRFSSFAQLTGVLTLDGQGQTDPEFIFQIGSTFVTASNALVRTINGADACDVFYQVGSSVTLGTGTTLEGTLIALASDTLTTGSIVNGRIIALNGAVTLDSSTVTVCSVPAPGVMLGVGIGVVVFGRGRRKGAVGGRCGGAWGWGGSACSEFERSWVIGSGAGGMQCG